MNKQGGNIDRIIDQAAAVSGQDRAQLDSMIQNNPQLGAMLGKLSAEDTAKLQELLSDPERTRKLLSTPQAQRLMQTLGGRNTKK